MPVFLTPDRVREIAAGGRRLTVRERLIPDGARSNKDQTAYCKKGDPVKPCRPLGGDGRPRGVCIHNTGDISVSPGTDPAEQYSRAMWPNCNLKGVAVHFFVWHGVIWQNLSETEQGWHAGDGDSRRLTDSRGSRVGGNLDTIAIECIGRDRESEETAALLAAHLLSKYGLTLRELFTHHDFTPSKTCPLYILPHWDAFAAQVAAAMDGAPATPAAETALPGGSLVRFTGGPHYASSTAARPAANCPPGLARLTRTAPGAPHPYHLIHEGAGSVYGWVDADRVASPAEAPAESPAPARVFPAASYGGSSLVSALNSVGAPSSFAYRTRIAGANGVSGYTGTAAQNLALLELLRRGALRVPD
ncbi:MAG: N-acetylmuramoyl-L-alanine amidase [Clostridia bacterium]|nr:N-acetylmuramoyl-L-alanine amidase [Clostridia bacterium]